MKHDAGAPAKQACEPDVQEPVAGHAGTLLGWYTTAHGRRHVRLIATDDSGLCVIDTAEDDAVLVEPRLEEVEEARALAADYLELASERGEPQTRLPWPPPVDGRPS
jgi:hypothetical protein